MGPVELVDYDVFYSLPILLRSFGESLVAVVVMWQTGMNYGEQRYNMVLWYNGIFKYFKSPTIECSWICGKNINSAQLKEVYKYL